MRLIALAGIVTGLALGASGSAGAAVLYHQVPSGSFTSSAFVSHDSSNDALDSQGADDFSIGDGQVWIVQGVEVLGGAGPQASGPHTAAVVIYRDAGGAPGDQAFSQSGLAIPDCVPNGECNFTAAPIGAPPLTPGTYWVSVQTAGTQEWFWTQYTPDATYGSPALWRNPGDAFGTSCTTFRPLIECGATASEGKDFVFALTGTLIDSRFSISKLGARGFRLFATVNVPAAGAMKIAGKGVKKGSKRLAAGSQRLRVKLNDGVLDRLRSGRNAKVRVKLTFTATGGDAYTRKAKAKLVPIRRAAAFRVAG
jgi:hypothetical protein